MPQQVIGTWRSIHDHRDDTNSISEFLALLARFWRRAEITADVDCPTPSTDYPYYSITFTREAIYIRVASKKGVVRIEQAYWCVGGTPPIPHWPSIANILHMDLPRGYGRVAGNLMLHLNHLAATMMDLWDRASHMTIMFTPGAFYIGSHNDGGIQPHHYPHGIAWKEARDAKPPVAPHQLFQAMSAPCPL
jgi:hypothetical protein